MNKDQKKMINEKPHCQIAGCTNLIPQDNPKDGQGNLLPLCAHHVDILKVVMWGLNHIQKVPQPQKPPTIIIPGINAPKNFDPRGN